MVYSYNYMLPPQMPYGNPERFHEYTQMHGLRNIADMLNRDFKYEQYSIDHWRIELTVFNRQKWDEFISKLNIYLHPWQSKILSELIKELDNENK